MSVAPATEEDDIVDVEISAFAQKLLENDREKRDRRYKGKGFARKAQESTDGLRRRRRDGADAGEDDQKEEEEEALPANEESAGLPLDFCDLDPQPRMVEKKVRFADEAGVSPSIPPKKRMPFNPIPPPPPPPPSLPPGFFEELPPSAIDSQATLDASIELPPPKPNPPPPPPPPRPPTPPPMSFSDTARASMDDLHLNPVPPPGPPPPPPPPPPTALLPLLRPFSVSSGLLGTAGDLEATVTSEGPFEKTTSRLYTRFMDELSEFVELQGSAISQRVEVQEKRMLLKNVRDLVGKCDKELFDYLRMCIAGGQVKNDPKLSQLFEASRAARDELGPIENDYDVLEIGLGATEFAVKEQYESLEYRYDNMLKVRTSVSTAVAPSSISFEPESDPESDISGEEEEQDEEERHPMTVDGAYISEAIQVGQLPIKFDASLGSIPLKKTTKDPKARATITRPGGIVPAADGAPYHDAREFSKGSRMADSLRGVGHVINMIDKLDYGSSGEDFKDASLQGISSGVDPMYQKPRRVLEELDCTTPPDYGESLLLLGDDSDTQTMLSDYLLTFESTRDRVNRWLLHKLRVSPWEVFELQRQVRHSSERIPDWANLALNLWHEDATEIGGPYNRDSEESHDAARHRSPPPPYPTTGQIRHRPRSKRKGRLIFDPDLDDWPPELLERLPGIPQEDEDIITPMADL